MNHLSITPLISNVSQKLGASYRAYPFGYMLGVPGTLLLIIAVFLLFCGPHLNAESLARVKNGMTPQQVTSIIGKPSESLTQGALGLTGTTYTYHHGSKEIKLDFLNDKLMAKEGQL